VALAVATSPGGLPAVAGDAPDLHDPWDRILAATVRASRVDYDAVRTHHLEALDRYLDGLARIDTDDLDRAEALAYWINLYNASMVREVVRQDLETWTPAEDDFAVFRRPLVRTADGAVSLDRVEHEIVRPRFGDARIHVALVCAAASCPPLLPRAYRAGDLDATLDANMRRFVNDPSRNRIDAAGRLLELSSLFDWFAGDFGGRDAIDEYVDRWTEPDVREFAVRFLEYDWSLNRARPAP
jgi:hypothetical protein